MKLIWEEGGEWHPEKQAVSHRRRKPALISVANFMHFHFEKNFVKSIYFSFSEWFHGNFCEKTVYIEGIVQLATLAALIHDWAAWLLIQFPLVPISTFSKSSFR